MPSSEHASGDLRPIPSGTTLAPSDSESPSNAPSMHLPKAEPLRTFRTPEEMQERDIDRENEEAEREFAEFGGDVPLDQARLRKVPTRARRLTGRSRARSRSGSTSSAFPSLHLVDSAFSDAHTELTRQSRLGDGAEESETTENDDKPDPNRVEWEENDPENPQRWSQRRKIGITALVSLLTINATFASSAPSSATKVFATVFAVSDEVAVLATSLFLVGYVVGPVLWSSLSEMLGRRVIFLSTMLVYVCFQIGEALAKNIETLLILRFLSGMFAAAPLTNAGGVIADIWDAIGRGPAMSVFTACVFIGPVMGPIVGGFVTASFLTWRWIFWLQGIFGFSCLVVTAIFLPETYAPVLLARRAKKMRKAEPEKNADIYADLERADFSLKSIITRTLMRPFRMLFLEPIVLLATVALSINYGILYGLFSMFPIIWGTVRGFNDGEVGLVFISVGLGTTLGAIINIIVQRHYRVLVPKWHGHPPPEQRLYGAMLAGPFSIIGIFLLGWTGNYASIPWYVPAISGIFLGMSFTLIFISFLSYLIEVYLMYSASALAANTIMRSAVGAAFPLFTTQMITGLGINWACTLLGGIAILISPSPFIFFKYGHRIREGSQFAPCLDLHMRERVEREEKEEREKGVGGQV